jgi:DNA-binding NarL/FixJ family response regulator
MLCSGVDDLTEGGNGTASTENGRAVGKPSRAEPRRLALFDARPLFGESLACWLRGADSRWVVSTFRDIDSLLSCVAAAHPVDVILFCESGFPEVFQALDRLASLSLSIPSVVVSADENPKAALEFIRRGARGFLPTSLDLRGASAVLDFVVAGGIFLPAMLFLHADVSAAPAQPPGGAELVDLGRGREPVEECGSLDLPLSSVSLEGSKLTVREAKVLECLCRGRPNKLIAYDLGLCESTVKMYVGRLMRKLNVRNRTEVALFADRLLKEQTSPRAERGPDGARSLYSVQPVHLTEPLPGHHA